MTTYVVYGGGTYVNWEREKRKSGCHAKLKNCTNVLYIQYNTCIHRHIGSIYTYSKEMLLCITYDNRTYTNVYLYR